MCASLNADDDLPVDLIFRRIFISAIDDKPHLLGIARRPISLPEAGDGAFR